MIHSQNLARMTPLERETFVAALTPREAAELPFLWEFWARPAQLLPQGDWVYWLPLGGRGCGKTRTGAEAVRRWAKTNAYVNIIGAAADDVRDVMVEGESGLINICPPDERPKFVAARNCLEWPNGARTLLFSAEAPERLRGKQHCKLWADELAAWRYPGSLGSGGVRAAARRAAASRHHDDAASDQTHSRIARQSADPCDARDDLRQSRQSAAKFYRPDFARL